MEKWIIQMKKADFCEIGKKFHIDPITARLIRNRNLTDEEQIRRYLLGGIEDLYDPHRMRDLDLAVQLLRQKICDHRRIRIIGDYDVDGVNAVYILYQGLKRCGAEIDYDIPDRVTDGYGINSRMVEEAYAAGIDTILTCDNGISAEEAVSRAHCLGMQVIVTDHHQLPEGILERLQADAIVNPHRPDCPYPYKELCGASVALKLVTALYESCAVPAEEWEPFLENAAIATVCDVVDLTDENRIIVKEGLKRLEHTANPGLRALLILTGLEGSHLTAYHMGFVLGPCINASGRLDSALRALRMLLSIDRAEAARIAGDLKALNESRKLQTARGVEEAISGIGTGQPGIGTGQPVHGSGQQKDLPRVLTVYLEDCHESLAGIIAGRLREKYNRPVYVFTPGIGTEQPGIGTEQPVHGSGQPERIPAILKGSGRSILEYSMYEELCKCQELLLRFGGHPMAAGLSIRREDLEEFARKTNELCQLTEEDLKARVDLDMVLPLRYINEELIREFHLLEPYGKENRKPLFALKDVEIMNLKVLGKNRNALRMKLRDPDGTFMDGILFGDADGFSDQIREKHGSAAAAILMDGGRSGIKLDIAYYPEINEFRGSRNIQITIVHYR